MLNRRRFALHATIAALGLIPLAAAPYARAEESGTHPEPHRVSPPARVGRGRPPRRRRSAATGKTTTTPRAAPQQAGTVLTAAQ